MLLFIIIMLRSKDSIFKFLSRKKIVDKTTGEVFLAQDEVLKIGSLLIVNNKQSRSPKSGKFLLTNDCLYYVSKLTQAPKDKLKLSYKACIHLDWLQTCFYTRRSEDSCTKECYFEIMRQRKAVKFQCLDTKDYQEWADHLTKSTIQTNFKAKYTVCERIGTASLGNLYSVRCNVTSKLYACKEFDKAKIESAKTLFSISNEIKLLRMFNGHPNIVEFCEVQETNEAVYLILEYLEGGRIVKSNVRYEEEEIKVIARAVLKGLMEIHSRGVVHRDLKPGNILLKYNDRPIAENDIKIIDFGISLDPTIEEDWFQNCGTVGYLSPESFYPKDESRITPKSDIYSLGVILHNAFTGSKLFRQPNEQLTYTANKRGFIDYSVNYHVSFPPERKLKS